VLKALCPTKRDSLLLCNCVLAIIIRFCHGVPKLPLAYYV